MGRFQHPVRVVEPAHPRDARRVGGYVLPALSIMSRTTSVGGTSVSNTLFRTKKVEQSILDTEEPEHALKKTLSALDLTVFGVGVIIGTGIFVLTGKVAKENAGPGVSLAFVAAGVACAL